MSQFEFIKELMDLQDLAQLEEAVDTSALKNSEEYKAIKAKDPKIADALELQWGYPEFQTYVKKVLDGINKKDSTYKSVSDSVLELSRLVKLHDQKFPAQKSSKGYDWSDHNTDVRAAKESLESFKANLTEEEFEELCENLGSLFTKR